MAENSSHSVCSAGRKCYNLNTEIIKSLAVQRLKKLEEQCVRHIKLINYYYINIMDH